MNNAPAKLSGTLTLSNGGPALGCTAAAVAAAIASFVALVLVGIVLESAEPYMSAIVILLTLIFICVFIIMLIELFRPRSW